MLAGRLGAGGGHHGGASAHLDGVAWIYRVHGARNDHLSDLPSPGWFTSAARARLRWRRLPFITGAQFSSRPAPAAATPLSLQGPLTAQTSQARAGAAPSGKISGTVPVISPGDGYALPGLQGLSQAHTSQACAGAAPPGKISGTVPVISPGGGCRLARPTGPLTGSYLVGPRKRSAAGKDIRHGTCNFAGWRLRLIRPTGSSYRLIPRRPAQAQRRRARYQARYL